LFTPCIQSRVNIFKFVHLLFMLLVQFFLDLMRWSGDMYVNVNGVNGGLD
jgi:hypothetical protein